MKIIKVEVVNDFCNLRKIDLLFYYQNKEDLVLVDSLNYDNQMYLAPFDFIDYIKDDPNIYDQIRIPFHSEGFKSYLDNVDKALLKVFHHTWFNELKDFLKSKDFTEILIKIKKVRNNTDVYPYQNLMFSEFLVPIYSINGLWIGESPYTNYKDANGRAFATWESAIPKSLEILKKGIAKDLDLTTYNLSNDLSQLTTKGIMLLNYAFAIDKEKKLIDEFIPLWKKIIEILNKKDNFSIIFFGNYAQKLLPLFNDSFVKFKTSHPISSAYTGIEWDTNNVFLNFNKQIRL